MRSVHGLGVLAVALVACEGRVVAGADDEAASETHSEGPETDEGEVDTGALPPQCTPATVEQDCGFDAQCVDGECVYEPPPCDEPECEETGDLVDVVIVVDNGASMGEEQQRLAQASGALLDALLALEGGGGNLLDPSVHVMVTTTDLGHPLCDDQPDEPEGGIPIATPCLNRLDDFTSTGPNPNVMPEVCENACPVAVAPLDPWLEVAATGTNVPGDRAKEALACLLPVGINGCVYASPLEAMRRALDPGASWNQGDRPFLREGSVVAVVLVSDKVDCSVAPGGYAFFTDPIHDVFWEIDPDFDAKTDPTPAICFNSSVECSPADANGVYADCEPVDDNGVLHPLDRYGDALGEQLGRGVVMLAMVGVPEVTSHDPAPPFHPLVGGVLDLVVRRWNDQAWPAGDLLPGDPESGPKKEWRWGIGPACTGLDGVGGFTGQALPSLRMNAVCQSLDRGPDPQDLRCIIESVCDTDPTQALWSLAGLVQNAVHDP